MKQSFQSNQAIHLHFNRNILTTARQSRTGNENFWKWNIKNRSDRSKRTNSEGGLVCYTAAFSVVRALCDDIKNGCEANLVPRVFFFLAFWAAGQRLARVTKWYSNSIHSLWIGKGQAGYIHATRA